MGGVTGQCHSQVDPFLQQELHALVFFELLAYLGQMLVLDEPGAALSFAAVAELVVGAAHTALSLRYTGFPSVLVRILSNAPENTRRVVDAKVPHAPRLVFQFRDADPVLGEHATLLNMIPP